ncbi:MATE family efflux transporter [Pararhodobacter sp.]|uniref:MATE family efflux transporter n=1 Tax=Pararhodobacter sp. TaxID=2127056 RepID=UPI002FDD2798
MEALTNRRVLRIALPIVLANVTVPLIGLVDTAVVGQLGQAAPIGAVGLGAVILAAVYWIFGFLRMGTTGLTAQAFGAGDIAETGAILKRGLLIAGAVGLTLIALQTHFLWGAFRLAPASDAVEDLTRSYLAIRIYGAPATIALYALTGWLIALERTRGVLVVQLVINLINVSLDLVFVLGLDWGVEGVAAASLVAEYTGLALALWLCRSAFTGPKGRVFDGPQLRRMASVNGDIMLRSVLLQGSITSFVFLAAGKGDVTLAANQILLQFLEVMAYLLDGFAFSAETLVGQAVGARRVAALRRTVRLTGAWGLGGAVLMAALFAATGPMVIDVMTTAPEVREAARLYLPWVVAAPMISIAGWMLDGVFIGATRTRDMLRAMLISVAFYALALWVFRGWDNHGLWAAYMVLNATRGVTMALFYPRIPASLKEAA